MLLVFKVGCVLSMSGALGAMGSKMTDAVKLAVDEINARGVITFDEGNDRIGGLYEIWDVVEENGERKLR
ncbi:hypothetical protein M1M92_03585 [Peptococcaceae bacterium]|nr:hypothetical protein [Peptococcaceae bacterium]MCL0052535.1 hypothetical protein [Peptococcaceae bacterium]